MRNLSQKISNAELEIMYALWENEGEMTLSQIWEAVGHNAKQTTHTLITRLVKKGAINQETRDIHYYTPVITKQEYNYDKTTELINRAYRGSAKELVAALFQEKALTNKDIEELKEFWSGQKNG